MTDPETHARSRTTSWDDPRRSAAAARTLAGRAFLEAIACGDLPAPPVMHLFNMHLGELDEGRIAFTLEPAEYHYNLIGSVHGGVSAPSATRRWAAPSLR